MSCVRIPVLHPVVHQEATVVIVTSRSEQPRVSEDTVEDSLGSLVWRPPDAADHGLYHPRDHLPHPLPVVPGDLRVDRPRVEAVAHHDLRGHRPGVVDLGQLTLAVQPVEGERACVRPATLAKLVIIHVKTFHHGKPETGRLVAQISSNLSTYA